MNAPHTMPSAARSRSASRAHDRRVLAAQLQHDRRQVRCAAAMMRLPVATLPVNTILSTRGSPTRARRHRVVRRDHVQHARRAGRRGGTGRPTLQARERRGGRRLQHHRVAGGERGGRADERDRERVVPGRDHQHDAVGIGQQAALLVGEQERLRLDLGLAQHVLRVRGQVLQRLERREDLGRVRLAGGLALLPGQQLRDRVRLFREQRARPLEEPGPLARTRARSRRGRRGARPRALRPPRPRTAGRPARTPARPPGRRRRGDRRPPGRSRPSTIDAKVSISIILRSPRGASPHR